MIEKIMPGASRAGLVPQPHEDYGRLEIDLSSARNDEEINIQGDYIGKISYDGSKTGCYFKFDHRHAAKIYAKEFKTAKRRYARIFLTNIAQNNKKLVLQISETVVSEITPAEEAIEEALDAYKGDDIVFDTGADKVCMVGAFVDDTSPMPIFEGNVGAMTMSRERELRVQAIPPYMTSDVLSVSTDAGTDETAAPGAGKAIEVLGYEITEFVQGNATINLAAHLEFETSLTPLWTGVLGSEPAHSNYMSSISGIRVRGAANKKVILTGADVNAAAGKVQAVIYYRIIPVVA